MPDYIDYLSRYKRLELPTPIDVTNYDWGRRMFEKNPPVIQNPDGSVSTHLMAAEVDHKGNWWAFPTIIRREGELIKLPTADAFQWNIKNNEAVPFGKDKDAALQFAQGGYKLGTPLQ
jgi:hypothetical protein